MNALYAVLRDLWWFALGQETAPRQATYPSGSGGEVSSFDRMNVSLVQQAAATVSDTEDVLDDVATLLNGPSVPAPTRGKAALSESVLLESMLYVQRPSVPLYAAPQMQFDGHVDVLSYGQQLTCDSVRDTMIHVNTNGQAGWIDRRAVTDRPETVFPQFTAGEQCSATASITTKLRAIIGDEFRAGAAGMSLHDAEYVTYRVWHTGHQIPWPSDATRRQAGRWRGLLAQQSGVRVTAAPVRGSIMEWYDPAHGDQVGYVEAVLPDESIRISTVQDSVYTESIYEKARWEALAPTFIQLL